jgi:hypothetical protein
MATIVTRAGKGSALTHTEVDANFTNLNTDKLQSGDTAASLTITSADINGGTIDGTSIGSSSASTGAFTTLSATGVTTVQAGTVSAPAITTSGDTNTGIFFPAADTIAFTEGGVESMRIDSSGNLGLGVTPSAWSGGFKGLQVGNAAALAGYSGNFAWLGCNWVNDGSGNKYINTGFATLYEQSSGQHIWQTAPSGTANNAITFTQAMTLAASGRLFLGTTSTGSAGLNVAADCNGTSDANTCLHVFSTSTSINANNGGRITFGDGNTGVIHSEIVRLRDGLDTFKINNRSSGPITFGTNDTERARIDSSGVLMVGTTSTNASRLSVDQSAAGSRAVFGINSNASSTSDGIFYGYCSTARSTDYNFLRFQNTTAIEFQVIGNGNVQNTNNSYGAISDIKLKENIVDATPKLEKLNQVRIVNFNMIGDEQKQIGVIAQELEQIFPSMVEETPDRDAEGNDLGTVTKAVKYSVFVPMLIKAMQEQQAMINELKAEVAALKGA